MKNKPSDTVYISNLNYKRDRNGLRSLFSSFGRILNIKIIVDPSTEQSRGMAFVKMGSVEEATAAIKELHGQVIDGRTVKANFAVPLKEERPKKKEEKPAAKAKSKDLDFRSSQIAKKERNLKKRNSNPLVFKAPTKKITAKKKS